MRKLNSEMIEKLKTEGIDESSLERLVSSSCELSDAELEGVAGGNVPPTAVAEGLDIGTTLRSNFCMMGCGNDLYRIVEFVGTGGFFMAECTRCKAVHWSLLKSCGGSGYEKVADALPETSKQDHYGDLLKPITIER